MLTFEEAIASALPGANPDQLSSDADPDGDGLINLIEVAFATDPGSAGDVPISTDRLDESTIQLTYRRPHQTFEGIDYILEMSADLETWTPMARDEFLLEDTPLPDGNLRVSVSIALLPGADEQFRVRVEM